MSIVNEMLTDLQKNKASKQSSVSSVNYFLPVNDSNQRLIISAITVLTIGIIVSSFFALSKNDGTTTLTLQSKNQIQPMNSTKKAQPNISKNSNFEMKNVIEKTTPVVEKIIVKPTLATSKNNIERTPKIIKPEVTTTKTPLTKPSKLLVKTTSRKTLAAKYLAEIIAQWKTINNQTRWSKMESFFSEYNDQSEMWLQALSFLKSNSASSFNQFMTLAVKQFPNNHQFTSLSARYHFEMGDFQQSIKQIEKIPNDEIHLINFQLAGLAYQKIGQHQKAIESYHKLLLDRPLRGDINMAVGISYEQLNQTQNAAKHFSIALNDNKLNKIQKDFVKQRLVAYQG